MTSKLFNDGYEEYKKKNYKEAYRLFESAAKLGEAKAMNNQACLIMDERIEKLSLDNCEKALNLYFESGKLRNSLALENIIDFSLIKTNEIVKHVFNESERNKALLLLEQQGITKEKYAKLLSIYYFRQEDYSKMLSYKKLRLELGFKDLVENENKNVDFVFLYKELLSLNQYDLCIKLILFLLTHNEYSNDHFVDYNEFWKFEYARVLLNMNKTDEAIKRFKEINNNKSIYRIARIYYDNAEYEKALSYFEDIDEPNNYQTNLFIIKCNKMCNGIINSDDLDELEKRIRINFMLAEERLMMNFDPDRKKSELKYSNTYFDDSDLKLFILEYATNDYDSYEDIESILFDFLEND